MGIVPFLQNVRTLKAVLWRHSPPSRTNKKAYLLSHVITPSWLSSCRHIWNGEVGTRCGVWTRGWATMLYEIRRGKKWTKWDSMCKSQVRNCGLLRGEEKPLRGSSDGTLRSWSCVLCSAVHLSKREGVRPGVPGWIGGILRHST